MKETNVGYANSGTDAPEPPAALAQKIMLAIERRERRLLIAKAAGFGVILAGSISFVVFSSINLIANLSQSGFFEFMSLFFSDFGAAMGNFQDFAFSIIESFPVLPALFLSCGIVAAIWAARNFWDDVAQMFVRKSLSPLTPINS